jgi:predicted ATPase
VSGAEGPRAAPRGEERGATAGPSARLPVEPTRFVGRARDLERIGSLLAEARIVTLWGPPGIGKTRTALQIARRHEGWFCDLSEARDLAALHAAVARGLGVTLGPDPETALARRLAALGAACVVLDNFEQLVAHAPATLGAWLEAAPAARFVVTSRERLRLREEVLVELLPLEQPREGQASAGAEALELLLDRVRAQRPAYAPDARELERLGRLVRLLEGIPLAIELAAARLPALGIEGLLERLDQRLELCGRGARGAGSRQATLRGAIEWSWQLLDAPLRRALARSSVFRGGFTLEAGEALIGPGAVEALEDLRDRSLLWSPSPGRFALYESIRDLAAEKLSAGRDEAPAGERADAEAAHARYYLELGERHAERFERSGGPIEVLALERDNLLGVLARAAEAERWDEAARAVLALGPVLATRGPARFHLELCDRVLAELEGDPRLHHARALVRRTLGDLEGAEDDLLRALEAVPEGALYVAARKDLGVVHHQRRAVDQARACYEAALAAARALGDARAEGLLIGNLGALAHDVGRFEEAGLRYAEALERLRVVGDARHEGIFLTNLGVLEQEEGRPEAARRRYERALALLADAGDRRFQAITLGNLGLLEQEAGALDAARRRHEQALSLLEEVGDVRSEALCRARLGAVLAALGAHGEAERCFEQAERNVVGRDRLALDLVRLYRCFLDLAQGDEAVASSRLGARAAGGRATEEQERLAEVSDDARMVLRMLGRSLRLDDFSGLEVGADARWFRAPGGGRTPLDKHGSARRILGRLVAQRLDRPGEALGADALFAAGWPGVTIRSESAQNRLYVALAKLRKLGLKLVLLRNDEGYLLDPRIAVRQRADA